MNKLKRNIAFALGIPGFVFPAVLILPLISSSVIVFLIFTLFYYTNISDKRYVHRGALIGVVLCVVGGTLLLLSNEYQATFPIIFLGYLHLLPTLVPLYLFAKIPVNWFGNSYLLGGISLVFGIILTHVVYCGILFDCMRRPRLKWIAIASIVLGLSANCLLLLLPGYGL